MIGRGARLTCGIGSEIEEELGNDVQRQQTILAQVIVSKADDDEDDCEHDETHELNWLAADGVDSGNCDPIPRYRTSADDNQVADGASAEHLVDVAALGKSDGGENDGIIEAETLGCLLVAALVQSRWAYVEGHIKEEP